MTPPSILYRQNAEKERFLTSPVKGTRYLFHVHAFSILASQPRLPAWVHHLEMPAGLNDEDKRHWSKLARNHESVVRAREASARTYLSSLGFSDADLGRPEIAMAFEERIQFLQLVDHLVDLGIGENSPELPLAPPYDRSICRDVIFAAHCALGNAGPSAVAAHLNAKTDGGRAENEGLSPDHVSRALKRHAEQLVKIAPRDRASFPRFLMAIEARLAEVNKQFHCLELIAKRAAAHPDLKLLRGPALADRIHELFDLGERVDRAYDMLFRPKAVAA